MENFQTKLLNNLLLQISKLRKENKDKKKDDIVLMSEKYNKKNEYFYLEVLLIEMLPMKSSSSFIYKNYMFPNLSPQEIFIKYLKGNDNNIMKNYRDLILYDTGNIDLFNMVTPNLTKNVWYLEKDLRANRLLKVFCIMNLTDMKKMLKTCPITNICLCPSQFKIDDPQFFINIINNLDNKKKKCFDFIPYLRNYSKHYTINSNAVYYLHGDIKKIDSNCFD